MKSAHNPNELSVASREPRCAFTLVELLVVISIIGILAALVVSGISQVAPKKAIATTKVKRMQLETMLDSYKIERGSYPPDNPANPGTNTLFYELTGVVFTNNLVVTANATFTSPLFPSVNLNSNDLWQAFGAYGIVNAARPGSQPKSYYIGITGNDYKEVTVSGRSVVLLTAPKQAQSDPSVLVTWRYDASSNRRHNMNTYDLWAEIVIKNQPRPVGNW